jgi:PRTRC genetic system protein B
MARRARFSAIATAGCSTLGLVFAVGGGKWFVYAVKGTQRPAPDTPLFRAPYFNVWADRGEICVGNVRTPGTTDHDAMEAWERSFFESRFTHPNEGFRVRFKGGGYAFWKHLLERGAGMPFPERALYPADRTLARLVRDMTQEPRS